MEERKDKEKNIEQKKVSPSRQSQEQLGLPLNINENETGMASIIKLDPAKNAGLKETPSHFETLKCGESDQVWNRHSLVR